MTTLICFALKEEAAPFLKLVAGKHEVPVLITGIGKANAEKSVREFLAGGASVPASRSQNQTRLVRSLAPPDLVLTCGFAGGLDTKLEIGDVVFEMAPLTQSLSPSNGERVADRPGEGLSAKLLAAGAKSAKIFCTDRIATTVAEKKKLRDETGADVVEMESAAIHAVCRERGIPCATIRVISDTANEDLPLDFNALSKADKSIDFGKLFLAIAKSPGKIGALMALQKKTQFAAQRLAEVLVKVLQQPE